MWRVFFSLAIVAIALFAAPGDPAFATTGASLHIFPPNKYVPLLSGYAQTNVDTDLAVGESAANERRSQGFTLSLTRPVGGVILWLKTTGAPTDNLTVQIQTNSGGKPSGTTVTNGTSSVVLGSKVGASYGWVAFSFSTPPRLTAGTQYHLVLKRSGSVSGTDYYVWGADQSSPGYSDGAASVYSGSWLATSPAMDHAFRAGSFTVDVYVQDVVTTEPCFPPDYMDACGLGGYTLKVQFDPAALQYVSFADGPFLTITGRTIFSCSNPLGHDPAAGVLIYSCATSGATPPGPEGSGVLARITFVPLDVGTTSLQFVTGYTNTILVDSYGTVLSYTAENGSVIVRDDYGSGDSDGDGCTDAQEIGDDPKKGGDRNPFFPYDFFDVPVPNVDPIPNGVRDKAVNMSDVFYVLFYAGTSPTRGANANGVAYNSDKGVDTNGDGIWDIPPDEIPDGRDYDRSPSWPFSDAPDNGVTMADVFTVLAQAGTSCVNPP